MAKRNEPGSAEIVKASNGESGTTANQTTAQTNTFDPNDVTEGNEAEIDQAVEKIREKFAGSEPGHKTDLDEVEETTETKAEDHEASEPATEALQIAELEQKHSQLNDPDRTQREGDHPSTESLTMAPATRPTTIDPMTGQVHYVGDEVALPGGTVAHEAG